MTKPTLQRARQSPSQSLLIARCVIAFCLVALTPKAYAQGCAQCRDNTASTTPATQRAFRHSIEFMIGAVSVFFTATFLVIRRHR